VGIDLLETTYLGTMKLAAANLRALGNLAGSTHALVASRGAIRRGVFLQLPLPTRILLLTNRWMTSAYSGEVGDGTLGLDKISSYVPFQTVVKKGRKVEIGPFQASEGWIDAVSCVHV
jgi:hypothetical protein